MINKIITQEKLPNGVTRYTNQKLKSYYDKHDNGRLECYNSDGVLIGETSERGFSYLYDLDGNLYSALAPDGELTLYNPDGSIKTKVKAIKKHFSALG